MGCVLWLAIGLLALSPSLAGAVGAPVTEKDEAPVSEDAATTKVAPVVTEAQAALPASATETPKALLVVLPSGVIRLDVVAADVHGTSGGLEAWTDPSIWLSWRVAMKAGLYDIVAITNRDRAWREDHAAVAVRVGDQLMVNRLVAERAVMQRGRLGLECRLGQVRLARSGETKVEFRPLEIVGGKQLELFRLEARPAVRAIDEPTTLTAEGEARLRAIIAEARGTPLPPPEEKPGRLSPREELEARVGASLMTTTVSTGGWSRHRAMLVGSLRAEEKGKTRLAIRPMTLSQHGGSFMDLYGGALRAANGRTVSLDPEKAEIHGALLTLRPEVDGEPARLTSWIDPTEWISWDIDLSKAGDYEVTIDYACSPLSEGAQFIVAFVE